MSFGWCIVKKLNIFLLYLGAAPVWPWQIQSTEQETEEQVDAHASRSADLCPQTCMMVPLWLYLSCYVELSRKRLVALWHRHIIKKKKTCTINISKTLFPVLQQSVVWWALRVLSVQIQSAVSKSCWNGARKTRRVTRKWTFKTSPNPGGPDWLCALWSTASDLSSCESHNH